MLQFHFHWESEHEIQGKKGMMEVHLVHQEPISGALAVLGVLIYKGAKNNFLGEVFEKSPEAGQPANELLDFNPNLLLPTNSNLYYTYSGSLTTPSSADPFATLYKDGLTWIVFKGGLSISSEQFSKYTEIYEEHNIREIQETGGRVIYEHVGK